MSASASPDTQIYTHAALGAPVLEAMPPELQVRASGREEKRGDSSQGPSW